MRRVLIVGATSAIAEASARLLAARGDALYLAGRNEKQLRAIADDLRLRGAPVVETQVLDARDMPACDDLIPKAAQALGGLDTALIAHGTLSDSSTEKNGAQLQDDMIVNAVSVMALCLALARHFEPQRQGTLAVISSVAGDRGRQSNFVYGAAKAAVNTFLSGLRQRLHGAGVAVITIKPGFVDTPMTAAFKKGALWATPAAVAGDIVRAIDQRRTVIYTPWFWRGVMFLIRSIPERLFVRLKI